MIHKIRFEEHHGTMNTENHTVMFYGTRYTNITQAISVLSAVNIRSIYKPFMYHGYAGVVTLDGHVVMCHNADTCVHFASDVDAAKKRIEECGLKRWRM